MRKLRLDIEDREKLHLASFASKSSDSEGAVNPREEDSIRTLYMQDRDRIIHSEYFRRLKDKAQVIMFSDAPFRTRLTHTLEVTQIARTIARALRLNEDLTESIGLGHDLGHCAFGHAGERAIQKYYPHFHHAAHSLRVVECLEKGVGLNLTFETRDGILKHTKGKSGSLISKDSSFMPKTNEGLVVRMSDAIAYINHDIDDAIKYGVLAEKDIPKEVVNVIGDNYSDRINNMVMGVLSASLEKSEVSIESEVLEAINTLKKFMFENVYECKRILNDTKKVYEIISCVFDHYLKNTDLIYKDELFYRAENYKDDVELVKDYVAHLTDNEALNIYNNIK